MAATRREFLQASAAAGALTGGVAESAAGQSLDPGWRPRAGDKQPNVLVIVLDDVGFADLGCYGSEHRTPNIDALAAAGTRFNNFHVTALCAPTRACLLTGRNAHAVGVGNIAEWGRDHPGYHGWIRQDAMTLAEMLRPMGYSTLATGKWHLSSLADQNGAGPFDHWPVRRGFDRWYGFHGNAMDHWHPEMFENTQAAYPEKDADYHLSTDLVDRSVDYIADHLAAAPDNPFFSYLAFGAMHFPLHAPAGDIKRYNGQYDQGWDVIREQRFQRQLAMGLIPANTNLPERNNDVPLWRDLSDDERRLAARGQEVYAAFLEHTDRQIGRLLEFLKSENQLDNTLIMLLSDNGAAYGGPIEGRLDVRRDAYLGRSPISEFVQDINLMGTDASYGSYSRGWAQASNTPLKWYKSDTYEGGVRAPLIVHWPAGELPDSKVNSQYHHVIDVVPSILTMINAQPPAQHLGIEPLAIQGTSFAYTFDAPDAPTRKQIQYFETLGDRAIWSEGWKAVARHQAGAPYEADQWELFHAAEDFSESTDLADKHPERLRALRALWRAEAERYDVLPMEDDTLSLYQKAVPVPRASYVFYPGMTRLDRLSAPDIYNYNSQFSADISLQSGRPNGVLLASGDSSCGYEWFVKDGYVHFVYVATRNEVYRVRSRRRLRGAETSLRVRINKQDTDLASIELLADSRSIGNGELPRMWQIYAPNSGLRCGENRHAPVSRDYEPPFIFDQALARIVVDVDIG